jgi:hypothetical protein
VKLDSPHEESQKEKRVQWKKGEKDIGRDGRNKERKRRRER